MIPRFPRPSILNRKLHRWGAVVVALPLLVVILSGLLLQVKKEFSWIQPPTMGGSSRQLTLSFARVLKIVNTVPKADIRTWADVDRIDVRPGKGMMKVRARNGWEVQIDSRTGRILQVAYRRSDWFESFHDGTFFHSQAKLWIFLPVAFILLGLWISGVYLWLLPWNARRRNRRRRSN